MMPDWESGDFALSDCIHWDRPEADCAGPRMVALPGEHGTIAICEHHFNHPPA